MLGEVVRLIFIWLFSSLGITAGLLAVHLVILVQRYSKDHAEVFWTYVGIALFIAVADACWLALRFIRRFFPSNKNTPAHRGAFPTTRSV